MVFFPHKNEYRIKYDHFIAAEQEFNTYTYGIKGKIDGTLLFRDPKGQKLTTAFEIKTGKYHSTSHRGQVMIYSLLITERFLNANPENILLYIMDDPISNGFKYHK